MRARSGSPTMEPRSPGSLVPRAVWMGVLDSRVVNWVVRYEPTRTSYFAHPLGTGPKGIGAPMLQGKFAVAGLNCFRGSASGLMSVVFWHGRPLYVPASDFCAATTAAVVRMNVYFMFQYCIRNLWRV
jgi:hypothetical protein